MKTIGDFFKSPLAQTSNSCLTSAMLRSRYDDDDRDDYDDEISEDDDDFYSPTGGYQGPEETDEDHDEIMSDLYGDDWNVV